MLSEAEVERFYAIWQPLLLYVNRRRRLVPSMLEYEPHDGRRWDVTNVETLRDALWADDAVREAFVADNPFGLPADDLAVVRGWRHRRAEMFGVLRHLKRYSIFIGEDSTVYGVLGLISPLSEVTPIVPGYVRAVLLPFAGRIVYDSLLVSIPVYLGAGIRAGLERTYADARERGAIVTSLPPPAPEPDSIRASNARVAAAFRMHLFASGLSERVVGRDAATVEELAGFLLDRSAPGSLRELDPGALRAFVTSPGSDRSQLTGLKRFVRFLRDTGRLDPGAAASASAVLGGSK
jgi:hypothetical protein